MVLGESSLAMEITTKANMLTGCQRASANINGLMVASIRGILSKA